MRLFCLMMVAGVGIVACGSDKAPTTFISPGGEACALDGPFVTPASKTIHVGDTLRFTVTMPTGVCALTTNAVLWSSSNAAVATVDSTGLARGQSTGSASIIVASMAEPTEKGAALVAVIP